LLLLLCLCFPETNWVPFTVRIPWPVARSRAR
jgi:hypothetical protein